MIQWRKAIEMKEFWSWICKIFKNSILNWNLIPEIPPSCRKECCLKNWFNGQKRCNSVKNFIRQIAYQILFHGVRGFSVNPGITFSTASHNLIPIKRCRFWSLTFLCLNSKSPKSKIRFRSIRGLIFFFVGSTWPTWKNKITSQLDPPDIIDPPSFVNILYLSLKKLIINIICIRDQLQNFKLLFFKSFPKNWPLFNLWLLPWLWFWPFFHITA